MRATFLALCVALWTQGCIIYPQFARVSPPGPGRGEVAREDIHALRLGSTTREEVLLFLGEPDLRRDDDRCFAYVWGEVWGFVGGDSSGANLTRHLALMLSFDDSGRLLRKERLGQPALGTDAEWYARLGAWK